MDRRTFLKGTLAAGLAAHPLGRAMQGGLEELAAPPTIEWILEGGSEQRRERLARYADDETFMRGITSLYGLPSELTNSDHTDIVGTLANLSALHGRPVDLEGATLEEALAETAGTYAHYEELAREALIDPLFFLAKMSSESTGRPDKPSKRNAQGLLQVLPSTYDFMYERSLLAVESARAVLPQDMHEELVTGVRPLRDLFLFTPQMARDYGFALDQTKINPASESLYRWIPWGIILERNYGGSLPYDNVSTESTLQNPELGFRTGAALSVTNAFENLYEGVQSILPNANSDPGEALAAFGVGPLAFPVSYIHGENGTGGIIRTIYERFGRDYKDPEIAQTFERVIAGNDHNAYTYASEVTRKTGALHLARS